MSLLTKTRKLNKLLLKTNGNPVDLTEMADVLKEALKANVFVIDAEGSIVGHAVMAEVVTSELHEKIVNELKLPDPYQQLIGQIQETHSNSLLTAELASVPAELADAFESKFLTVVPIIGGGDRLGTLVLVRMTEFEDDDLVLAEYGATMIGMEVLRERAVEMEKQARNRTVVQLAVGSLSFSELEAVEHIFEELSGKEGLLVASKIADRVGITRSVIVNALRKLESAGVIETRSLGMKGTYIKILNDRLIPELKKARA